MPLPSDIPPRTEEQPKILVVEDEVIIGLDLQKKLESLGYVVPNPIQYGEDLLGAVVRENPLLILMDVNLKGELNGLDAGRLVKEQYDIPIIFLTAYADDETFAEAKKLNPHAFIQKPVSFENLRLSIEVALYKTRIDRELLLSEERYRRIFENSIAGIFQSTAEGQFIRVNQAFAHILGYPTPALLLERVTDIGTHYYVDAEDRVAFQNILATQGQVKDLEIRVRARDGSFLWVLNNTLAVKDAAGRIDYYEGSIIDITKRKQAELDLREREQFLSNVFSSVQDGICVLDCNFNIVRANGWLERMYPDQLPLVGKKCYQVFQQRDSVCSWCPSVKAIETAKSQTVEAPYPTAEGPEKYLDLTVYPLFDNQRRLTGVIEYLRDNSELKQLEQQLRQKLKMEAIGVMAGGIAHNFNNQLAVILGNIELAELKKADPEDVAVFLGNAKQSIFRSRDLIQQLLTYTSQGAHRMQAVSAEKIVDDMLKLWGAVLPSSVNLVLNKFSPPRETMVMADPSAVQDALISLCNNAVQAMKEAGTLTLGLETVILEEEDIPAQFNCGPGRYVRLSVEDSGCGMEPSLVDKIFDPFFTTKAVDQGIGMGLSSTQGMVIQHRGLIKVDSRPGEGTTISLFLPQVDDSPVKAIPAAKSELLHGSGRILFVEDNDELLKLVTKQLEGLGYSVTAMTDSSEALRLFKSNPSAFDLLISDEVMTGLKGKELIARIKAIRPEIKAILYTGYAEDMTPEHAHDLGIDLLLRKPLFLPDFAEMIKALANDSGSQG